MFKKSLMVLSIFMLFGCGATYQKPAYKISDIDMKIFFLRTNNLEHCIYPQLKGLNFEQASHAVYSKWSKAESLAMFKFHADNIRSIIGEHNARLIASDPASQQYFQKKFSQMDRNITNVDKKKCDDFKKVYYAEVRKMEENIKKSEKEQLARQKQAEKERKAREAYYATPQGQAELARQQYQQTLLAQQQMYQQQLEAQRQNYQWQQLGNTITNSLNSLANTMNQQANMYNSMTRSMPVYQYQAPSTSSSTCYSYGVGNNMIHCKHR